MGLEQIAQALRQQGVTVTPAYLGKWLGKQVQAGTLLSTGAGRFALPDAG